MPNWSDDEGRCHFEVNGVPCYQSPIGCPIHGGSPAKTHKAVVGERDLAEVQLTKVLRERDSAERLLNQTEEMYRRAIQEKVEAQSALVTQYRELEEARAEAAAYKRDFEAELAGNAALRQKHGARENETMFNFIDRVVKERDHFKAMLRERAEALLKAQEELERLARRK